MKKGMLFILALLVGCHKGAIGSRSLDDHTAIEPSDLTITLTHQASGPEWALHYEFASPVHSVIFPTKGTDFHTRYWAIDPHGDASWSSQSEVLTANKPGGTFSSVDFTFDRFGVNDDALLLREFSDQSVAIDWSMFAAYRVEMSSEKATTTRFLPTIKVVPRAGEHVMADGRESDTEISFTMPQRSTGGYAYFGNLHLEEHQGMPFLIDPAVPPTLATASIDAVGRAMTYFTDQFSELPFKPTVILQHIDATSGFNVSGFAMWGQFLIKLYGNDLPSDAQKEWMLNAVVHETSHFWNAFSYQALEDKTLFDDLPESKAISWLREGGAQSLALEAMRSTNMLTADRYQAKRSELLDLCLNTLGTARVIDAPSSASLTWAPYHCGEMVEYQVVLMAQQTQPNFGLIDLWQGIFAASHSKEYDNETFFTLVKKVVPAISDDQLNKLKRILVAPGPEIQDLVMGLNP